MLRAAAAAAALVACLAAPGVSLAQSSRTIRIYDAAGQPADWRADAIAAAAAIFSDAGVPMTWLDCGRHGADHPCTGTRQPRDLVVRIVPEAAGPDAPAASAVTADTLRLGFAAVTAHEQGGVVATVYAGHVRRIADRTGVAFPLLLGRAIAHEVGHLLPGSHDHSATGLMRAVWTDAELRRNRGGDWAYFVEGAPERTTRLSGWAVDGSSRVAPGVAPLD